MLCKRLLEHSEFKFAFWNFMEFFLPNILDLHLVESTNAEHTDTEGGVYQDHAGH